MKAHKKTVVVVFGGQSTEHEISCRSARFLFRQIPRDRYQLAALAVTKEGRLIPQNLERIEQEVNPSVAIIESESADPVSTSAFQRLRQFLDSASKRNESVDDSLIVFSIMHGTFGEDGCWQGFWELAGVPYVGVDVLGAAVAMDKEIAKKLVSLADVPIVPYVSVRAEEWLRDQQGVLARVEKYLPNISYFIKPANLGSSVGISQASNRSELAAGIERALSFDTKVLVEQGMDVREIEFALLGGAQPKVSLPGEVVSNTGFYSYETKYIDADAAKILIPAPLTERQVKEGQALALRVYEALNLYGMSRVDLFLENSTGQFFFNEANTLPGLTNVSQYPLLWEHMGVTPSELLHELIETALQRHGHKRRLQRVLSSK